MNKERLQINERQNRTYHTTFIDNFLNDSAIFTNNLSYQSSGYLNTFFAILKHTTRFFDGIFSLKQQQSFSQSVQGIANAIA